MWYKIGINAQAQYDASGEQVLLTKLVGEVRFELTWVAPADFKSAASTIPPLALCRGSSHRNYNIYSGYRQSLRPVYSTKIR